MTTFKDWTPPRYAVFAELTGGHDKGYRYRVIPNFRVKTLDDAKRAIREETKALTRPDTFGGLIDWGTYSPREYAIYELNPVRVL